MSKSGISLGRRIRNARCQQWRSQAELAEIVGLSQQMFSSVEQDRHVPPATVLVKVANELSLPETELYALAGRLRPVALAYMRRMPSLWTLIHRVAARQLSAADLDQVATLVEQLGHDTLGSRQR